MKEQADIAQKAGYHRHDDTLPLLVYRSAYSRRRTCRGKAPPSANADRSVAVANANLLQTKNVPEPFLTEKGSGTYCLVEN